MAAVPTGHYPTAAFSDATVSFSFWFTKLNCTGDVYEYMWSQTKNLRQNIMSPSNSNINVFMSCGGQFLNAAGLGNARAAFLRVNMMDSQGSLLNYDWVLHPAGADPILQQWFSVTLSIDGRGATTGAPSVRTFLDGVPVGEFGFHPTVALCHLNAAYPDPRTLNVALSGFDLGNANLYLGGRGIRMSDRHFKGSIAGTTIYDLALSTQQVKCGFAATRQSNGHTWIRTIPASHFGCTDPKATNYAPTARVQHGICHYPPVCWVKSPLATSGSSSKWVDAAQMVAARLPGSRRRQLQAAPGTRNCAVGSSVICRWSMTDDGFFVLPLPFSFRWFGANHSHLGVSANGFVVFGTLSSLTGTYMGRSSSNTLPIPNSALPNNAAFVLWTDLDPSSRAGGNGGQVFTWADADKLVVEWNTPHYSSRRSIGAPNANFQIVLHRATNSATFNYQQHSAKAAPVWAPIAVGVENARGDAGAAGRRGSVQMSFGDPVEPQPGSSVFWPGSCLM
jgi:hypothetical protein